jgi:PIN domain nuclease of toxin-antitoxin system
VRVLIDSHCVIWAVDDPSRLSAAAVNALQDSANELLLSAATIWEIAIKAGLGRLSLSMPYRQWMERAIADLGLTVVPISVDYADAQAQLPWHHRDPFDRLLAAQAQVENVSLVSGDAMFDRYGVERIWEGAPR